MSDFRKLDYKVQQCDMGQIVVVSYAMDADYLYRKHYDLSDRSSSYSRAPLDMDEDTESVFEPQNNKLPTVGEWEDYIQRFMIWDDTIRYIIEGDDLECALDYAEKKWQDGSWDEKQTIQIYAQEIDWDGKTIGDSITREIEVGEDSPAPDCTEDEHGWRAPQSCVGGISDNPGCWSTGGTTMVFKRVCRHCGTYKIETRYGYQRNPGQRDKVEYTEPDDKSRRFVAECNNYVGWYDCVNDRYGNYSEPYETPEEFLDMVDTCFGSEKDYAPPELSCENEDGEIYATTSDGERELTLVKRVKKELD